MDSPRWRNLAEALGEIATLVAVTLGSVVGLLGAFLLPIAVVVLIYPVVPISCDGVALCLTILGGLGAIGVGLGIATLLWLSQRGYLSLPRGW